MQFHRWGLGFRQCSFRHITRVLRDGTFSVFQCPPLFRHALFPSGFSPSGQSDDPGAFLRAPPDWVRDSTPRSAAHSFSTFLQWSPLTIASVAPCRSILDDLQRCFSVPHARTSTCCHQVNLSPFAMCPVFPDSDYYGDSVAIGLAPIRRSCGSLIQYVRAWVRPSVRPYARTHRPVSSPSGVRPLTAWGAVGVSLASSQHSKGPSSGPIKIGLQVV